MRAPAGGSSAAASSSRGMVGTRSLKKRPTGVCFFLDHFCSCAPLRRLSKARAKTDGAKRSAAECSERRIIRRGDSAAAGALLLAAVAPPLSPLGGSASATTLLFMIPGSVNRAAASFCERAAELCVLSARNFNCERTERSRLLSSKAGQPTLTAAPPARACAAENARESFRAHSAGQSNLRTRGPPIARRRRRLSKESVLVAAFQSVSCWPALQRQLAAHRQAAPRSSSTPLPASRLARERCPPSSPTSASSSRATPATPAPPRLPSPRLLAPRRCCP